MSNDGTCSENGCRGCYGCYGCYNSFALSDCKATYKSLFSKGLFGDKFKLFNQPSTEKRIEEVRSKLNYFSWYPKQTNAFDLYVQNGDTWSKIDSSKLTTKSWDVSWNDCPKEMLAYIQSIPEFDSALFKEISGIELAGKAKCPPPVQEKPIQIEPSHITLPTNRPDLVERAYQIFFPTPSPLPPMSITDNAVKAYRNSKLNAQERRLRKVGFKDECGNWTDKAVRTLIEMKLDEEGHKNLDVIAQAIIKEDECDDE